MHMNRISHAVHAYWTNNLACVTDFFDGMNYEYETPLMNNVLLIHSDYTVHPNEHDRTRMHSNRIGLHSET